MSGLRKLELIYPTPSLIFEETTSILSPFHIQQTLDFTLDLLNPNPTPFDLFLGSPFAIPSQLVLPRVNSVSRTESYLNSLSDRIAALEDALLVPKPKAKAKVDRKYTWTAQISSDEKDGLDRKYKLTTEIKSGKKKEEEKKYKWTAEIKGKGENSKLNRKYTFEASVDNAAAEEDDDSKKKKKDKNDVVSKKSKKPVAAHPRVVEIEDSTDHGAIVLRQAFAKRAAAKSKGKRKELSYQDAALMIQVSFRAYLIRRSQALRALRELAVAKAKLKEIRALFNNFTYRRRLSRDAEEMQKFTERVIVLLLTVDAIEGADVMVRTAKRSMVDELEAMLDVVDPQPQGQGRSLSMKRRTFDMPDGAIQKEIAAGVAQVVQMLNEEDERAEF